MIRLRAGLNSKQWNTYSKLLKEARIVELVDSKGYKTYRLTRKGHRVLNRIHQIELFLEPIASFESIAQPQEENFDSVQELLQQRV